MVKITAAPPDSANLTFWGFVGASAVLALETNDGDTSYVFGSSTGQMEVSKTFTVPSGARVFRLGFDCVRCTLGTTPTQAFTVALNGASPSPGSWNATGTYAQLAEQTVDVGEVASGGSHVVTAVVGPGADLGGGGLRFTQFRLALWYNRSPLAPTLTAPIGTTGSLTPVFTGVQNDPDGDGISAVEIEVRRVSDNALMWSSNAAVSSFSRAYAGSTLTSGVQYKWRARTSDNSGDLAGAQGAWSDFVNFTPVINNPPVASIVSPTANATVGSLTPTLQFGYSDPDGNAQGGYQIQVRRFSDQVSFWDTGQVAGAVTSRAYAGTTLVGGTRYEWRVRVQDSLGSWSDYTSWASFTPQAVPNPPTLTSPSGLTNTLTPTIQGTYNQASGASQAAFQYEIRQGGITLYSSGDVAVAIATGQAYGTDNGGDTPSSPPALAWGTSYEVRARSKDTNGAYSEWSAWQAFATNAAPTTPTSLQPNGAVTGNTTPTLSWTHNDPNGDAQTEAEVELEEVGGSTVTGYGPKTLTQSGGTHTITETLTSSPATEYRWRVRTKGTSGPGFGPWSDWVTFTVATAPQFTVDTPAPAAVVTAPALTVDWTMTGGSGTQQSYRVRIYAEDQTTLVHDSGVQSGTDDEYTLASGILKTGREYHVRVSGEDTLNQAAQSGLIGFSTAWTPPATITGLQVQMIGDQS